MAEKTRKRVHGIDRRQALVDAGLVLLASSQTEPKVEDVTSAAGTAKGTFYTYFASWDAFLAEVRVSLLTDYANEMQERMGNVNKRSYWRYLEQEVIHYIRWTKEQDLLHQRVFHAGSTDEIPPGVSASRVIEDTIQRGVSMGLVRQGLKMHIIAPLVFQTVHGAAALATPTTIDEVGRAAAGFIRAALEQKPGK